MISELATWLIVALPQAAGLTIAGAIRPWNQSLWSYSGYIGIAGVGGAFLLSLVAVNATMANYEGFRAAFMVRSGRHWNTTSLRDDGGNFT